MLSRATKPGSAVENVVMKKQGEWLIQIAE